MTKKNPAIKSAPAGHLKFSQNMVVHRALSMVAAAVVQRARSNASQRRVTKRDR